MKGKKKRKILNTKNAEHARSREYLFKFQYLLGTECMNPNIRCEFRLL